MQTAVSDISALLRTLPLLQDLPPEEAEALARVARARHVKQETVLFIEGDPGDAAYIVLSGRVDLVLEDAQGNQLLLQQVDAGGYFGEMALLDGKPRSATALVSKDTELVAIAREHFLDFLWRQPATMLRLLRVMSERVRAADAKIKILGFLGVAGRLASTLLELDRAAGRPGPISVRHDQLAAMIGSSRQTVSTMLGEWRAQGYIITGRGKIVIVDRPALESIAAL